MTRLLLCTAAILALTTSALAVELPTEMVNENWRICNEDDVNQTQDIYAPNNARECPNAGWAIYLWKTGYSVAGRGSCEFDKIEKTATGAYQVHANCKINWSQGNKHGTDFRTENLKLEIINRQLVITTLSAAEHSTERWRCGPYDITIVDLNVGDYHRFTNNFQVRKNGRDVGYNVFRSEMNTREDGARVAAWSGLTGNRSYWVSGELVTRNGVSTYTENLHPGKQGAEDRVLKSAKHPCKARTP